MNDCKKLMLKTTYCSSIYRDTGTRV